MSDEIVILMAAGLGTRMMPLTEKVPKPLIKVFGKTMIESIIDGLESRSIKHIYVVVGYKKEQFAFLKDKYSNLSLIENNEYMTVNNISSIHAASHIMGNENCFICEADLFISDQSIFMKDLKQSCYYGKTVKGHSDDWVFRLDNNGRIISIEKCGDDLYNMVGISYFLAGDAEIIARSVNEAYSHPGEYEQLYWDEIVNRELGRIDMRIAEVEADMITEIDSVSGLSAVDPDYKEYN